MKRVNSCLTWAVPALLLAAGPVYAHPMAERLTDGFVGGLLHPLSGIDHLLAMVAVGIWAMQLGGSAVWKVPPAFVIAMLFGAGLGLTGIALPWIEPMIATSVVVLGLVIGTQARMPLGLASLLVAMFALFHGHAHLAELPTAVSTANYVVGFVVTTTILHGLGMAVCHFLHRRANGILVRIGGMSVAGAGVWLLAGM